MLENSTVMERLLNAMFMISKRKTTEINTISIMDSLLSTLSSRYNFLKSVEVKDVRYLENENAISVMNEIDTVSPAEVGRAINEFLKSMDGALGRKAGHFFFKEISNRLGDDVTTMMRDEMGVDISLLQLEKEVSTLEKRVSEKVNFE